jgi:nitrogen fixation/metabolism regulation signal transduction histidine kinase
MKYVLQQFKQTVLEFRDMLALSKRPADDVVTTILSGPFFQHAVANPLTCLNLSIHSAEKYLQINRPTEALSYLSLAHTATNRMLELFYLLSSDSLPTIKKFDLTQASHEVISTCQVNHPQAIFQLTLPDHPIYHPSNVFLFQEVLLCLVNNSIESYTKPKQKPIVSIIIRKSYQKIHLTVSDGGQGMSWLTQLLISTAGFTTKPAGSGIGLRFSKKYVEEILGGQMLITSTTGKGTQVKITIPA